MPDVISGGKEAIMLSISPGGIEAIIASASAGVGIGGALVGICPPSIICSLGIPMFHHLLKGTA